MSVNFKKQKDQLFFVPLGGAGEIGMNLNLYHYQGKWLIVDCGAGFADDYFPGIDMLMPDITFLEQFKDDIVGAVFTHAHEDHLGAVQHVWDNIGCPIYATPFTASLLRAKLKESSFGKQVKINLVQSGSAFDVEPFKLEMVQITHSVPEMNAVFIRTDKGNILHTGDWKFDPNPVVGATTDFEKLEKLGDEGVLALVGDSTNVFKAEHSKSEGDLEESLSGLISGCSKMVVVATFASNVARIETIAKATKAAGRHLVVAGRSLHRIIQCAKETGYLRDMPKHYDESEFSRLPRDKVVLLCTGCQGEPRAAMNRIVNGTHRHVKMKPGEAVIFSSKIIPGNEKRINWLLNQLARQEIEVMTERDHFVHVSGHPGREELKRMYELVKPQIAIPVHGEIIHMHEHAKWAKAWGVPQAVQLEDGDIIRLENGKAESVGVAPARPLGLDGYSFLPGDGAVLRTRRRIRNEGVIVAVLVIDQQGQLLTDPVVTAPGLLDNEEDGDLLQDMVEEVGVAVTNQYPSNKRKLDIKLLKTITRGVINRIVSAELGKRPLIDIHIQEVE